QINTSEGQQQQEINLANGRKQAEILRAEGEARAIELVANATGAAIRTIAAAVAIEGGLEALQLQVARDFIDRWANLAKQSTTMIIPADLGNIGAMIGTALAIIKGESKLGAMSPPGSVPVTGFPR
ncbi:MAG: band-7 C-terminal domain-containing protein, partial [Acetobacteraceae bacterium]